MLVNRHFLLGSLLSMGITFSGATYASAQENLETLEQAETATTEPSQSEQPEVDPQANNPAAQSTGPRLDEVIVTAQKRAEDVQDVPISVTAIGEETLELKGIEGLGTLQLITPNVKIDAGAFFNFIYVRGIGSDNNLGFDSSVGLFFDGVHMGRRSFIDQDFLDVGRVELLRGPQGALFGKNTIAGALAVYTNPADFEWGGELSYKRGFEHFSEKDERFSVAVNVPIYKDMVAARGAYASHDQPGFMYNTKLDRAEPVTNDHFWRAKLRFKPSENLDISLSHDRTKLDQVGSGAQLTLLSPDHEPLFALFDPEVEGDGTDATNSTDAGDWAKRETTFTTLTADLELGDFTLTSISNYSTIEETGFLDVDFSPVPVLTLLNSEEYEQLSQEFRLVSPEGRFQYITGLYYFWSEFDAFQSVPLVPLVDITNIALGLGALPGEITSALAPFLADFPEFSAEDGADERTNKVKQETISMSAFLEMNYEVVTDVTLTVGLRLNREEKNATQVLEHANGGLLFAAIVPGEEAFDIDESRVEYHFSPRLVGAWHIDDDQMLYASATKGTKSGGFNASALNESQTTFDDEVAFGYEAGYRSKWLGGALMANVSVFRSVFKGLQVSAFNGTQYVVTNAADAISQGIELEGAMALSENLFIAGAFGILDAKFDKFETGPCPAGTAEEDTPCDLSGKQLANAPKQSGNIAVFYDVPVFNWGFNFHASGEGFYQGDIFFQTDLDPVDFRAGQWLWSGRLGVHHPEDMWRVLLYINNISGAKDIVGSADVPIFAGSHFGGGGGGRTYQLEARFKF
ncbi:MAG: TonB-dependent receptor [Alphaproteobacteria bacterium]